MVYPLLRRLTLRRRRLPPSFILYSFLFSKVQSAEAGAPLLITISLGRVVETGTGTSSRRAASPHMRYGAVRGGSGEEQVHIVPK